jgi:hypothetical protein
MSVYADTPAGQMRREIDTGTSNWVFDEPDWIVDAMIAAAKQNPAPKRLALGSESYQRIRDALTERLRELDADSQVSTGVQV